MDRPILRGGRPRGGQLVVWLLPLFVATRTSSSFAVAVTPPTEFVPFVWQSGTNEEHKSSYAVSMVRNNNNNNDRPSSSGLPSAVEEVTIVGGSYGTYFVPSFTVEGGGSSSSHNNNNSKKESSSSTETSDCFVATLQLQSNNDNNNNQKRIIQQRRQFGNADVSEFCSGIVNNNNDRNQPNNNLYVIGHSYGQGGLLSELLPVPPPAAASTNDNIDEGSSQPSSSVYGLILDLDRTVSTTTTTDTTNDNDHNTGTSEDDNTKEKVGVQLQGGRLVSSHSVQFPVQLTVDHTSTMTTSTTISASTTTTSSSPYQGKKDLFVVTLFANNEDDNYDFDGTSSMTNGIMVYNQNHHQDSSTTGRVYRGGQDLAATGYRKPQGTRPGTIFSVRVQRLQQQQPSSVPITVSVPEETNHEFELTISKTLTPKWTRRFDISRTQEKKKEVKDEEVDNDDTVVQISSLSHIKVSSSSSFLIMTGYTKGKVGSAYFGYPSGSHGVRNATSWDSFITKINPMTGTHIGTHRIEPQLQPGNTRIFGFCDTPPPPSNNEKKKEEEDTSSSRIFVYVVGMTEGIFDRTYHPDNYPFEQGGTNAFLLKLDVTDDAPLQVVWSRQIAAATESDQYQFDNGHQIHGMACAVTHDGEHVYMAGNILDGATLAIRGLSTDEIPSLGADDIFVTQFRTKDGELQFARQIGSSEDDTLAHGKSLLTTEPTEGSGGGDLIVLGNTRGSLFRNKTNGGVSDVFVMTIDRETGDYVGFKGRGTGGQQFSPVVSNIVPPPRPPGLYTGKGADPGSDSNNSTTTPSSDHDDLDVKKTEEILSVTLILGLSIFLMGCALMARRMKQNARQRSSSLVSTVRSPNRHHQLDLRDAVDMVLERQHSWSSRGSRRGTTTIGTHEFQEFLQQHESNKIQNLHPIHPLSPLRRKSPLRANSEKPINFNHSSLLTGGRSSSSLGGRSSSSLTDGSTKGGEDEGQSFLLNSRVV